MMMQKTNFIWFNGEMVLWEEAKVHVMSHSLHYGSSVFEGIRCYESYTGPVLFRHEDHMKRLINSAKIYRIPVDMTVNDLMQASRSVLCKNNLTSGYVRPLIMIGDVGMDINPPINFKTDVIIAVFSWNSYFGVKFLSKGIEVMISSWNRVSVNTIPFIAKVGGNYLSSMLIGEEARRNGYQEGIALDIHGYISEGPGENIFAVKDDILFTPPVISSILPGITRDTIIKLAKFINLEVREQMLSREFLYLSDEVFMTGTAVEIIPVRSIDGLQVGINSKCGSITKKLQQLFFGLFTGNTEDIWGWLDTV